MQRYDAGVVIGNVSVTAESIDRTSSDVVGCWVWRGKRDTNHYPIMCFVVAAKYTDSYWPAVALSLSVDLFTGLSDIPDWIADIPVPLLLLLYTTSWYLAQDNALNVACGTDVIVTCRYCALSVSERLECLTFAQLLQKCHRSLLNSWR